MRIPPKLKVLGEGFGETLLTRRFSPILSLWKANGKTA
jgi:hypothetical protein